MPAAFLIAASIALSCPQPGGWKFAVDEAETGEPGVRVATVRFEAAKPSARPAFTAALVRPQGDAPENRSAIARLRLTNGGTACHSDMLTWGRGDAREDAARQILAGLFGTVQYSVRLDGLPEDQRRPAQRRTCRPV